LQAHSKFEHMKYLSLIALFFVFNIALAQTAINNKPINPVLVIHGGAGTILKKNMSPEKERAYIAGLEAALKKGYAILQEGGTSLDAVEAVVKVLENNPLFNAGKGAVFTNEGKIELDAAIMNGKTLAAGSVAGVTTIKNPVAAARAVMEKSEHVMMIGRGAEKFAALQGLTIVDPSYFYTEERWKSLETIKKEDSLRSTTEASDKKDPNGIKQEENKDSKYGTVGAVALDKQGNLAAATSTGGMTNKKFGRVGDVPIIGAGTYANNTTCAISCTGWGEFFIRLVMAKSISDMMEFGKMSLQEAATEMVMKKLPSMKGDGGLIGVDINGNITMPFCTEGMYRGFIDRTGKMEIKIYKD
jgi:beta-aspartyl-peptidase (threonine type)